MPHRRANSVSGLMQRPQDQSTGEGAPTTNNQTTDNVVVPVQMDDRGPAVGTGVRSGALRPPGELGHQLSTTSARTQVPSPHQALTDPLTLRARQRTSEAIVRSRKTEEAAASRLEAEYQKTQKENVKGSLVTTLCYHGMEVMFATTSKPAACYAMCARTRLVFQKLDMPSDEDADVIALQSNTVTGQVVLAQADGKVRSYTPEPVDPKETSFGAYRWWNGPTIMCDSIFYQAANIGATSFGSLPNCEPGECLDISISRDYIILVAHSDQLAVFDTTPTQASDSKQTEADLLWTTRLPGKVVTAKISGDGQSIALVLESKQSGQSDDDDDAAADGVHTFERDFDDGSSVGKSSQNSSGVPSRKPERSMLVRAPSVGILYKSGPFLVHSAPVTRLSFRGLGHLTSSPLDDQMNDLLLSYCQEDSSARIYAQSNWKPLVEWTSPPHTRVDWVRGISAFTLGDLETQKKGGTTVRSRSTSIEEESAVPLTPSSPRRQGHFHNVPSHTATLFSNAGAWITEVTFQNRAPAVRLSRLTYMKRGMDDLNPTLFESVSSFLPAGSLFRDSVLASGEACLTVDGIWPSWNPWLSASTTPIETLETLRGSAMDNLGLASGPGAVGSGFFGDNLLGGTQSPPSEIRMTVTHPLTGRIVVLEFPLFGDCDLTALELGNPTRHVLSLSDLDPRRSGDTEVVVAGIDHEEDRLVASVSDGSKSISIAWMTSGTMSLLPSTWLPEDADPSKAPTVLGNATRFRDESLISPPVSLSPIYLPSELEERDRSVTCLLWWPNDTFGGPTRLLALTSRGTVVVFEIPPPRSTLEPAMPSEDRTFPATMTFDLNGVSPGSPDGDDESVLEYEVSITPDSEYGLGLRLESQVEGMCAIAGSYKKHPLTGEALPAEKCGMISLGDELLSAGGKSLESKTFDEIISAVRDIGASCGPGNPMRMKFRRVPRLERRVAGAEESVGRRSMEQILGVAPGDVSRRAHGDGSQRSDHSRSRLTDSSHGMYLSEPLEDCVTQDPCTVLAIFPEILKMSRDNLPSNDIRSTIELVPCCKLVASDDSLNGASAALFFHLEGSTLRVLHLDVEGDERRRGRKGAEVGKLDLEKEFHCDVGHCRAMHIFDVSEGACKIVTCDSMGVVRLIQASIASPPSITSMQLSFRSNELLRLSERPAAGLNLQACSVGLLATMQSSAVGCQVIDVWSASPRSTYKDTLAGTTMEPQQYTAFQVANESSSTSKESFLDFSFRASSSLEVAPALVAFSHSAAILHLRKRNCNEWVPMLRVAYSGIEGSNPDDRLMRKRPLWGGTVGATPRDVFPHLLPSLVSVCKFPDEEEFLRSDWHPDAMFAHICADRRGAEAALTGRIRNIFRWLCAEGSETSEGYLPGQLVVAPLDFLNEQEDDLDKAGKNATEKVSSSSEFEALSALQSSLQNRLSNNPQAWNERSAPEDALPAMLAKVGQLDLSLVWAMGELVSEPPPLESLDTCGQLFLFSAFLFQKLKETFPVDGATPPKMVVHSRLRRSGMSSKQPPAVASSACLSALLSNSQDHLIERCKRGRKLIDWSFIREIKAAFWIREDSTLARLSEEIGQATFREKRDILGCALFFIIAGKLKTLRNLSATDRSDSGRKFFKFLTTHDFSSERGRRAAEKNAYSLLRKCQYKQASALFLLADPPFLKSALETIVTKMHDVELAFMVARLVESPELKAGSLGPMSLGSSFGGGGGYASSTVIDVSTPVAATKFSQWHPKLGYEAKRLLADRGIHLCGTDHPFVALQLVWLGKREEAAWFLCNTFEVGAGKELRFSLVQDPARRFIDELTDKSQSNANPIRRANALIDFMSSPMVLENLGTSASARFAASYIVSSTMLSRGLEVASMEILLRFASIQASDEETEPAPAPSDPLSATEKESQDPGVGGTTSSTRRDGSVGGMNSSIFDSFEIPTVKKPAPSVVKASDSMESSIFDAFDVPPVKKAAPPAAAMESSIFDSFDVPPVKKAAPPAAAMESSIFDSFDVPPVKKAAPPAAAMESSIFDSFDVPPVKKAAPPAAAMESSIFDSFDAPPVKKYQSSPSVPVTSGPDPSSPARKSVATVAEIKIPLVVDDSMPAPLLWAEWKEDLLVMGAARRLLREIATTVSSFHGDPVDLPIDVYYGQDRLVSPHVSEVLQLPCDSERIIDSLRSVIDMLCSEMSLQKHVVVERALSLLGPAFWKRRLVFATLLLLTLDRRDLAEDSVRQAATSTIHRCTALALSNDHIADGRMTRAHASSQFVRRDGARSSWELESCLWLHRGGGLPLSGVALQEAVVAVRVGLLLASWNHNFECLEALIQNDPDCLTDEAEGRHLWTSLKMLTSTNQHPTSKKTASGGWEFLVDCKRSQATQMLRERPTGSFIMRPHPEDYGVFTLSFKTNLVPSSDAGQEREDRTPEASGDEPTEQDRPKKKKVRKDDVVQHAIVRLSDSGFRCGSFGPFASLIQLLEVVSSSLPFHLRFDLPPVDRVIKEEGSQTSPNAVLLRKIALMGTRDLTSKPPMNGMHDSSTPIVSKTLSSDASCSRSSIRESLSVFLELQILSSLRVQLSSVAAVQYDDVSSAEIRDGLNEERGANMTEKDAVFASASRLLRPFLVWCRAREAGVVAALAPGLENIVSEGESSSVELKESPSAIEVAAHPATKGSSSADSVLRRLIQQGSGVEFTTLRLVDGGECTLVLLFNRKDAIQWFVNNGLEESQEDAVALLETMEHRRVIESIDLSRLSLKQKGALTEEGLRYRFVDPWEVEALSNRDGETRSATLGRDRFLGFSLGKVALVCEPLLRSMGGLPLLELWTSSKSGVMLTKALACAQPPWEREAGGDLLLENGVVSEPAPFLNSIRQSLYRNALFRRLELPQRFVALVQVELLDLKNLTTPGGSLSLTVYALLRLKRTGSSAALTNKSRTLDSASTTPVKLGKSTGPNAPASWGTVVRFRFPLPEDVSVDGTSYDKDRESLFRGPPCVLQVSVYEKKLLVDHALGTADIAMDGLWSGSQLEEWVPLRSEKHGINWFARIRMTLRFELMCLGNEDVPSVGRQRIEELGRAAVHEDSQLHSRSMSSPDLLAYFESMVY